MFSKLFLFLFIVVGIFTLLFAFIPSDFFVASYTATLGTQRDLEEKLETADLTVYTQLGADNMTYPYQSVLDGPSPPDWEILGTTDHCFEVWWNQETAVYGVGKTLECRHTYKVWWWWEYHRMMWYYPDTMESAGRFMGPVTLDATYDAEIGGSKWYASCNHMLASIIIAYNETAYSSFQEAWDANALGYTVSYEANATLSGASATSMLGQLIAFQSPDLGIDGDLGTMLNTGIATIFYAMVILLIVMVIQSLIPFIRGLPE